MVAFRSETMVFNRPLDEDGFYALTVSRFIALGSGITIDGHTMTNGFQPLWVFLNAALYWLVDGDRMLGIRLTLLLHWALYVTTGLVLGLIAARILPRHFKGLSPRIAGLTTALVYLSAPKIWLFSFNGMETSLLLFMTALSVLTYMELSDKGYKGLVACGLVLGLLVLSRIDTAFFVVILSFTQLFRKAPPMQRFVRISMLGGIPLFVSMPWWIFNYANFHAFMPISGQALLASGISTDRIWLALGAIVEDLTPHIYISSAENSLTIAVRALAFSGLVYSVRHDLLGILRVVKCAEKEVISAFLIFILVLILWYPSNSVATYFYARYFVDISMISALVCTIALIRIWRLYTITLTPSIMALPMQIVVFVFIAFTGVLFKGHVMLTDQVPLVEKFVPPNDLVAAGQTGTLGFMRDHVVNLDGKVNPEALQHRGNMRAYLRMKKVYWIADVEGYIFKYIGEHPERVGWKRIATSGIVQLYQFREPASPVQ